MKAIKRTGFVFERGNSEKQHFSWQLYGYL